MTDVCVTINSTTNEYLRCPTNGTAPFIREFCRSPMQWDATANAGFNNGTKTWLPVSTNFKTVNVAYQKGANGSHLEIFKHLMRLRKTEAGVSGVLTIESLSNDVLMIQRVLSDKKKESIVAFFNFGNSSASLKAINETHYPNEVKIELTRLNSLYKTGWVHSFVIVTSLLSSFSFSSDRKWKRRKFSWVLTIYSSPHSTAQRHWHWVLFWFS